MPGKVIRAVFALLLLAAQQGALSHQIWHAATAVHTGVEAVQVPDGGKSIQERLCEFDATLGSVLGALNGAHLQHDGPPSSHVPVTTRALPEPRLVFLAASSRGPPASL